MANKLWSNLVDFSPVVVEQQASLQTAIAAMKQANFTAIWVVETKNDDHRRLVGAVFPAQLLLAVTTAQNLETVTVESLLRDDLPQLKLTDEIDLEQWVQYFEQYQVDFLPVVHANHAFAGVMSKWQLLQNCVERHSLNLLEQLFASAQDGFFMMMLDEPITWDETIDKTTMLEYVFQHQRITQVNDALLQQYGVNQDEILGKTPADFFAHDLAHGKYVWQRFFDHGSMSETTAERRLDDDTPIWISGAYTCLYDEHDRILGHFGIQRDVTHYQQMEACLMRQEQYLSVIMAVQQQLLSSGHQFIFDYLNQPNRTAALETSLSLSTNLSQLRPIYQDILRRLGETAGASRVYLFENHGDRLMSQQLEWCAEGITPEIDNPVLQNLSYDNYCPRWLEKLARSEPINGVTSEFPKSEQLILEPLGVLSILLLPIHVRGDFWGFIGFDNCQEAIAWNESEVALLATGAAALSMHLENCQVAYQLYRNWYRKRLTYQLVERMHQTLQIDDIFAATTRDLRSLLGCDRTLIYRFNSDWSGSFIAESVSPDWPPLSQLYPDSPLLEQNTTNVAACKVQTWQTRVPIEVDTFLQASQGGEYRQGKPYSCVTDIYQANFEPCYLELLASVQARAYLLTPIFLGNHLWGLLCNYQNSGPRQWDSDDISLVLQITTQLGVALQHVELLEQSRRQALELAKAKAAAEAATQARTEFLANVSHELRTPLNAILGFSEILGDEMEPSPDQKQDATHAEHQEYISIISRNGQYLLNLINNVVEVARLESGQSQLLATTFDLPQLLHDIEDIYTKRVTQKGLKLIFWLSPQLPQTITSDREKLLQVLLNLLNNAIKFTQSGSIVLKADVHSKVEVDSQISSINLAFTVKDTGVGIAPEDLSHLFQPFSKPQTSRQTNQGPGLGLAISKKFVNMLGGDISVTSTVNHGSLFKFNIWAVVAPPAAIAPEATSPKLDPPASNTYRISIVETHSQDSYQLKQVLSPLNCDLRTANTGQAALQLWAEWHPHLLLIDWRLAMIDDQSVAQQIHLQNRPPSFDRADPSRVTTKVIGLVPRHQGLSLNLSPADFDDILDWPTQPADLLAILAKHLDITQQSLSPPLAVNETASLMDNLQFNLPRSCLAQTSLAWRQQLYQAALTGSDEKLSHLITQLAPAHRPLSQLLTTLTENFQFDQIIALLSDI